MRVLEFAILYNDWQANSAGTICVHANAVWQFQSALIYVTGHLPGLALEILKPFQNKKGQTKFEVDKKAVFSLKKGLHFCRVPQIFWPFLF